MTTIVPTSEEDPVLAIIRFTGELAWSDAGTEVASSHVDRLYREAHEFMVADRWLDLVSLMLTSADLVCGKISDKDMECIFTIVCSMVAKARSLDEALEMGKLISARVSQQPNDKPALRLKILFNLYNLLENPYSRFFVYMKALHLAVNGKVVEHIIPSFKLIDNYLNEWKIGTLDRRELFYMISNALKDSKSYSKESLDFLIKYLATFSLEDAYTMSDAKEAAVRAIIEFIKAPNMFQCDLLEMPAVAQLEKDGKYALVYQLLKIFLMHRLDTYLEFQATQSTLLKNYGLSHEDCITKMRLMSLADLASGESYKIPFSVLREALQITDDEVEFWIVKAITSKLLDCRIDQMTQTVVVRRQTERTFGMTQWEDLRSRLGAWRANIANVVGIIQANKLTEDGTLAMKGLPTR